MARYQILYWKEYASQVKASDEHGEVKEMLPQNFQEAIDRAAMKGGEFASDAYLEGWNWSEEMEMPGSAQEVLRAVVEKLIGES